MSAHSIRALGCTQRTNMPCAHAETCPRAPCAYWAAHSAHAPGLSSCWCLQSGLTSCQRVAGLLRGSHAHVPAEAALRYAAAARECSSSSTQPGAAGSMHVCVHCVWCVTRLGASGRAPGWLRGRYSRPSPWAHEGCEAHFPCFVGLGETLSRCIAHALHAVGCRLDAYWRWCRPGACRHLFLLRQSASGLLAPSLLLSKEAESAVACQFSLPKKSSSFRTRDCC